MMHQQQHPHRIGPTTHDVGSDGDDEKEKEKEKEKEEREEEKGDPRFIMMDTAREEGIIVTMDPGPANLHPPRGGGMGGIGSGDDLQAHPNPNPATTTTRTTTTTTTPATPLTPHKNVVHHGLGSSSHVHVGESLR